MKLIGELSYYIKPGIANNKKMHSYNNFQWDENYPQVKDFAGDIKKGDLFIFIREGKIVGFIVNTNQMLVNIFRTSINKS